MSNALTTLQIQQAIDQRIQGRSYNQIAGTLGLANDRAFRNLITEALRQSLYEISMDIELSIALDLARSEALLAAVFPAATIPDKEGKISLASVKTALNILRDKREYYRMIMEIQRELADGDEETGLTNLMTTDAPEFQKATLAIYEERTGTPPPGRSSKAIEHLTAKVPAEDRDLLETQLDELDIAVTSMLPKDFEDDETE